MLTQKRINELASAPGVKKQSVLRFLGSLDGTASPADVRRIYENDRLFYKYNAATQRAMLIGMRESGLAPKTATPKKPTRVLMVFDGKAWYVRGVRAIEHDGVRDEKIYYCDKHLGGPLTLDKAVALTKALQKTT